MVPGSDGLEDAERFLRHNRMLLRDCEASRQKLQAATQEVSDLCNKAQALLSERCELMLLLAPYRSSGKEG